MAPKARKRLFDFLRIVICAAALWIVIRGVTLDDRVTLKASDTVLVGAVTDVGDPIVIRLADGSTRRVPHAEVAVAEDGALRIAYGLRSAWRISNRGLLLLAVIVNLPVAVFQGIRLRWLLVAQDIHISYGDGVKLSFAGNFLNFATPLGSHAGDVCKAYFITTHTEHKTEAVATIALDRVIGLGTLVATVAAITAFSASDSRLALARPYVLAVFGAGVAGILAYLSPFLRQHLIPHGLVSRLPMLEQLQRLDRAACALARRWRIVVAAVLVTLVLQVLAIGSYFIVAVALSLEAHVGNVLEYYACFYTGAVIQALPGPPQGLGTVELAYRYFFAPYGSPSQIVCVALAIRLVVLVCALPGLLVTLTGSYRPREPAREADAAVPSPGAADPKCDLAGP